MSYMTSILLLILMSLRVDAAPIKLKAQIIENGSATLTLPTVTGTLVNEGDTEAVLPSQSGNAGKVLSTDGVTASWQASPSGGGLVLSGSVGSPNVITAGGGVSVLVQQRQLVFTVSNGGAVTVTANPRVQAGSTSGQELILVGTSDSNYIILDDGNGLALNGSVSLKNKKAVYLIWDGFVWFEVSRQ